MFFYLSAYVILVFSASEANFSCVLFFLPSPSCINKSVHTCLCAARLSRKLEIENTSTLIHLPHLVNFASAHPAVREPRVILTGCLCLALIIAESN